MGMIARALNRVRASLVTRTAMSDIGPEEFVRLAYLVVLKRQIDASGLASWRRQIGCGSFNSQRVFETLLASEEYEKHFGIDIFQRLHAARQAWIRTVAAYDSILDIGGSSPVLPEGGLIALGYPHRPKTIDILDLPPDRQFWGPPVFDQSKPQSFDWGRVTYYHGSAETIDDVDELRDRTYDCIFLGQAIEHVYPDKLTGLLNWIRIHLNHGGRLVFDTPNRIITKIHSPDAYINADHKLEYTPDQMERVLRSAGFTVVRKVGMMYLPEMAGSNVYDAREFNRGALLHDDVDACYLFAFEAVVDEQHGQKVAQET